MQTLTSEIVAHGLANRVLRDAQFARLVAGSDQRRYHLASRAAKAGELHRLKRGLYVLDARFRDHPAHLFALSQALVAGSYVSFESALAHHGWIPEATRVVASVNPGTKSLQYELPALGQFTFSPLTTLPGAFLELVERLQIDQQVALVASPPRALMDLVCQRKVEWQGMGWLTDGLRIDSESLQTITRADIATLKLTYQQKRVQQFLKFFARELGHD